MRYWYLFLISANKSAESCIVVLSGYAVLNNCQNI